MKKKSDEIKIDGIVIKDHKTVSFTTAFVVALLCFIVGVFSYQFFYMVLPQRPGCIQIMVKTTDGISVKEASVIVVLNRTGNEVASGLTNENGRIEFCGYFLPNEGYDAFIMKGDLGGTVHFTTNERSTASFPVIVRTRTP